MIPKQRRGCGRGVSANPCKGMKDVGKNHHLITPNITTDSGMDHQWMLKAQGEMLENRVFTQPPSITARTTYYLRRGEWDVLTEDVAVTSITT